MEPIFADGILYIPISEDKKILRGVTLSGCVETILKGTSFFGQTDITFEEVIIYSHPQFAKSADLLKMVLNRIKQEEGSNKKKNIRNVTKMGGSDLRFVLRYFFFFFCWFLKLR